MPKRQTGRYRTTNTGGERVRAFIPHPLPPRAPPLRLDSRLADLLSGAMEAIGRLAVAGAMVPSPNWFLYGFVRKEAVVSSQIEGTQATLRDVLEYEANDKADVPEDVEEVSAYIDAIGWARREIARPGGLPLSIRLLCQTHQRLMSGARGAEQQPGAIRRSQNWIGGTRPGNARFVPPPPEDLPKALAELERWLHADDPLPPLVRAGLAHVQFGTIHPFLDGNGRIGRLLISLLIEHWGLLSLPLLYLSLAFRRRQPDYYNRLQAVRTEGDWEGWTAFFLECVREAANDGVLLAELLFRLVGKDRQKVLRAGGMTIPAARLFDLLPSHPMLTLGRAIDLLDSTKPTASKAIGALIKAGILREITGKRRDRVYAYHEYLETLTGESPNSA